MSCDDTLTDFEGGSEVVSKKNIQQQRGLRKVHSTLTAHSTSEFVFQGCKEVVKVDYC